MIAFIVFLLSVGVFSALSVAFSEESKLEGFIFFVAAALFSILLIGLYVEKPIKVDSPKEIRVDTTVTCENSICDTSYVYRKVRE